MAKRGFCPECQRRYTWLFDVPLAEAGCPVCWGPLERLSVKAKFDVTQANTWAIIKAGEKRISLAAASRVRRQEIHEHDKALVGQNEHRWRRS